MGGSIPVCAQFPRHRITRFAFAASLRPSTCRSCQVENASACCTVARRGSSVAPGRIGHALYEVNGRVSVEYLADAPQAAPQGQLCILGDIEPGISV